jgi:hypothetical protein
VGAEIGHEIGDSGLEGRPSSPGATVDDDDDPLAGTTGSPAPRMS